MHFTVKTDNSSSVHYIHFFDNSPKHKIYGKHKIVPEHYLFSFYVIRDPQKAILKEDIQLFCFLDFYFFYTKMEGVKWTTTVV